VTGTSANAFQYTGRENDGPALSGVEGTGLYYYRARYYQPRLQRFIAEDPIGLTAGVNFYAYVENKPANWIDPLGLIRYNKPPPATVPVKGQTLQNLLCVEKCLQNATGKCNLDLLITGGAEQSGHSRNSAHYGGEAVDIAGPLHNPVSNSDVMQCAAGCGFGAGQFESFHNNPNRDHWHFQLYPGNGVPPIP